MDFLFHFAFTLLKVSLQASLYAALLLVLARVVGRPGSWIARASEDARRFWVGSGFIVSVALVLFSFSYWGGHGFGDHSRIPLGRGEAIEQMNGVTTYFPPVTDIDQPELETFQLAHDMLCAKANDSYYFTYDLATKRLQTFPDEQAYNAYAKGNRLPSATQFKPFYWHYSRYWNGWRFWLLA